MEKCHISIKVNHVQKIFEIPKSNLQLARYLTSMSPKINDGDFEHKVGYKTSNRTFDGNPYSASSLQDDLPLHQSHGGNLLRPVSNFFSVFPASTTRHMTPPYWNRYKTPMVHKVDAIPTNRANCCLISGN